MSDEMISNFHKMVWNQIRNVDRAQVIGFINKALLIKSFEIDYSKVDQRVIKVEFHDVERHWNKIELDFFINLNR